MVHAQLIPMHFCDFSNINFLSEELLAMCVVVHAYVVNTQKPTLKCYVPSTDEQYYIVLFALVLNFIKLITQFYNLCFCNILVVVIMQ